MDEQINTIIAYRPRILRDQDTDMIEILNLMRGRTNIYFASVQQTQRKFFMYCRFFKSPAPPLLA
jgi:hypothetical protein